MARTVYILPLLFASLACGQTFTVSGISSGAFMAVQMHVAYSQNVTGAGIIAGGPYYCAQGSEILAVTTCMDTLFQPNSGDLVQYAQSQSESGIDDLANLKDDNVWIFSGLLDTLVSKPVVFSLVDFYANFITSGSVVTEYTIPAEHSWVTETYGNACPVLMSPFLNACLYDAAGALLAQIYGTLNPKGTAVEENLLIFDQTQFTTSAAMMSDQAYVYVPTSCQNGAPCKVHLSIHGCSMDYGHIGTDFVANSGLNEWAETNDLVVVYPQVPESLLTNPEACWDWWGYTGANYALKSGPQMQALYAMAAYYEAKYAGSQAVY